ncbi:MAG: hypothetical protein JXL67_08910 [Calditrichaeota bacterium]|nr:hypothetical protein [Calditrichota bacterium]
MKINLSKPKSPTIFQNGMALGVRGAMVISLTRISQSAEFPHRFQSFEKIFSIRVGN